MGPRHPNWIVFTIKKALEAFTMRADWLKWLYFYNPDFYITMTMKSYSSLFIGNSDQIFDCTWRFANGSLPLTSFFWLVTLGLASFAWASCLFQDSNFHWSFQDPDKKRYPQTLPLSSPTTDISPIFCAHASQEKIHNLNSAKKFTSLPTVWICWSRIWKSHSHPEVDVTRVHVENCHGYNYNINKSAPDDEHASNVKAGGTPFML